MIIFHLAHAVLIKFDSLEVISSDDTTLFDLRLTQIRRSQLLIRYLRFGWQFMVNHLFGVIQWIQQIPDYIMLLTA